MRELKVGEKVFVELEVERKHRDMGKDVIVFKEPSFATIGIYEKDINILEKPEFEFGEEIEVNAEFAEMWKKRIFVGMKGNRYICVVTGEENNFHNGFEFKVCTKWEEARKINKEATKLSRTSLLAIAKEKLGYDVEIEE